MTKPTRKCHCAGNCVPVSTDLNRRDFLGLSAAGTAAVLASPALFATRLSAAELDDWKKTLLEPGAPRVYRSDVHTDARLHLGGIGTGNFELGADGQFTTWQLFNTLRDGHVPFHFAVKAGAVTRLLQTTGGPASPRVPKIEMTGAYPFARLRYLDPDLPVQLELEAFSPFAPLDTRLSSTPLAVFAFRIRNGGTQPQTVALAAFLQNPVGYDAAGSITDNTHPALGGNINEPFREGPAAGLVFRAQAAPPAALDRPVRLYAGPNLNGLSSPPPDRPDSLEVRSTDRLPAKPADIPDPAHTVIWFEEPAADIPEPQLRAARDAVLAGATLVFSGASSPLLATYARATHGQPLGEADPARPDLLFEDFEHGYDKWQVEGRAFGPKPARGTLPNQQRVSGFVGQGLVNTYFEGDVTTGRLVSPAFKVERHYLRFLIGGGSHANTQARLIVDNQVVRSAAGRDVEQLLPVSWDIREFAGKEARIEIVDENTSPWGHINVDQIEFSDIPANLALFRLLEELLPARFSDARAVSRTEPGNPNTVELDALTLRDGTASEAGPDGLRLLRRRCGSGQVVVATGAILRPADTGVVRLRQNAYQRLCSLVGANYRPVNGTPANAPGFGTLALATLGPAPSATHFADWPDAWTPFNARGGFTPLTTDPGAPEALRPNEPTPPGRTLGGAVATTVTVAPGAEVTVPFLLAWCYPNKYAADGSLMGCHYATVWTDARAVVREAAAHLEEWTAATDRFRRSFHDSTLPHWLLDCVTANAAIIRHIGVVFRIANGDPYGWEGSNGCCQPTCTHVWGYEQSLARLFPDLEREMRRIDFKHQQRPDGGVNNRTDVPSPPRPTGEQPFADGHASCILKAYREALNCPDESFFRDYWSPVKRGVEYLIGRDAASHAGQPAGCLEDDQWNTYDEALHGVTTFISGYYLAALRAGEEWARRMGDDTAAVRFHSVFEQGRNRLVELCWNGEYFQQHLPDYLARPGEVGPGCMSDQLIGQWWAHQLGLGYILPKDKIVAALKAVFRHNWKADLTGWKHAPRAFAGDRDKGLIICTWPKGGRPGHVMLYSDEVWTGIEYQVAAHMLYEGLIEEGLAIVKGARERYDGLPRAPIPRNPWNEIECGGHYARALSSWSLLLAAAGWFYDGPRRVLALDPRVRPENYRGFFTAPEAWGTLRHAASTTAQRVEIDVASGRLPLARIILTLPAGFQPSRVQAQSGAQPVPATLALKAGQAEIRFEPEFVAAPGRKIAMDLA
jgi:uncharacterized protein (DUF608 family)